MRRKKEDRAEALGSPDGRITPGDVQQVEFRLAFRGYNERDVDGFLDRVTEDLASYIEENRRLRAGGGAVTDERPFVGDEQDARMEAEAIVARAREDASEIVRRAERRAAALRAPGGGPAGDARGAVAPFLNTEREFLQSLGSLVQEHAEEIKQMVLALRAHAEAGHASGAVEPSRAAAGAAPAGETHQRLGEPEPADAKGTVGEPADTAAANAEPIVVESAAEHAYSSEGAPANEGRERSLRELFWGDD